MNKAVPWSIKGIDFDAREAAKEAARRDGLTLGEWMNRAITDRAAEIGANAQEFDAEERLEAVAAQLARLSREREEDAPPQRRRGEAGRRPRVVAAAPDLSVWEEDSVSERDARRRPSSPAKERLYGKTAREDEADDGVNSHPAYAGRDGGDSDALLEQAVTAFQKQAGRAEARTARAIANVATLIESAESERAGALAQVDSRLAEIEQKINSGSKESVKPLQDMISSVHDRLGEIETRLLKSEPPVGRQPAPEPQGRASARLETPAEESALRQLDNRLTSILARIEKAEASPPGEARDEQFSRLERRFDGLMARLDRQNPRVAPPAAPARRGLDDAKTEIAARQRALEAAPAIRLAAPSAPPLAALIDERFEALARKLDRAAQSAPAAPAEDLRIDRLQHGIDALSGRIEDMRREFSVASLSSRASRDSGAGVEKALRDLTHRVEAALSAPSAASPVDLERLHSDIAAMGRALTDVAPRGAVAGLESAMRDLSNRVESARDAMLRASETRGQSDASGEIEILRDVTRRVEAALSAHSAARPADLEKLRSDIASMGRVLADVAPRGAVTGLEAAIRDLGQRVESARTAMMRASEMRGQSDASGEIEVLRELTRRVETALSAHSAAGPADLEKLRSDIASMGRVLADVAPRGAVTGLEAAIRDLGQRVESARDVMLRASEARGQSATSSEIDVLARQVAAMGRALEDVAPRSQMASLENAVLALGDRIESSRMDGLREGVLAPIESLADELRRAMAEAGASANFEGVAQQLRDVESKIEHLRHTGGGDREDFLQVRNQSDELRAMIAEAVEQTAPLRRIESQVADLSEKLEQMAVQTRAAGRAQEAGFVAGLARSAEGWRGVEMRLDDLALRIERAAGERSEPQGVEDSRFDDLSRRLDYVHQALAARIESAQDEAQGRAPATPPTLEPLLRSLAEKLETAMAPQADSRALEALERQIAQVSERLDRGDPQTSAKLERAIEDLAQKFELSRESEREAVRQAFRETLADLPNPPRDAATAREIADLREKHNASDRRAQMTLSAVHETLEKVVDRLAMIEDEVLESRAAHPEPASAGAAAPRPTAPSLDFDDDFLMEPGAGRPGERLAAQRLGDSGEDKSDEQDMDAPLAAVGARSDESTQKSKPAPETQKANQQANYIDVARRAIAARGAAEAAEKADAERRKPVKAARPPAARAASFVRPLASGEAAGGRRLPALLLAAGTVLAIGAYQAYRVFDNAPPPMQSVVESRVESGQPATAAPQEDKTAAPPVASAAAPAAAPSAAAPAAAPAQSPATALPGAAPAPRPAQGASLPDPLAVGSIGARPNTMAAVQAGAQMASIKQLAEKGAAAAQFDLAARFLEGRGVARDQAAAIGWFEKAAAQGLAQAQYRLGAIYEKGVGVPRDARKAADYYEKAANQGNIRAMHNLAVMEAEGIEGKPDYNTAAQWFRRAAEFGVRDSQFNLAILYARGMGVAQNMTQSYAWFAIAAQQGDEDAAKKRDEIGARLDAPTLEAAKKQATEFHARTPAAAANDPPPLPSGPAAAAFVAPAPRAAALSRL
jgi:localization factor PodJL